MVSSISFISSEHEEEKEKKKITKDNDSPVTSTVSVVNTANNQNSYVLLAPKRHQHSDISLILWTAGHKEMDKSLIGRTFLNFLDTNWIFSDVSHLFDTNQCHLVTFTAFFTCNFQIVIRFTSTQDQLRNRFRSFDCLVRYESLERCVLNHIIERTSTS